MGGQTDDGLLTYSRHTACKHAMLIWKVTRCDEAEVDGVFGPNTLLLRYQTTYGSVYFVRQEPFEPTATREKTVLKMSETVDPTKTADAGRIVGHSFFPFCSMCRCWVEVRSLGGSGVNLSVATVSDSSVACGDSF